MFIRSLLLLLTLCALTARADIVVENDLIVPEEIYDFLYSTDSTVWWQSVNTTKYYCIFRSMWTKAHHPKEYPPNARWGPVVMYSAVKEFRPWLKNRATTLGIETLAENRFSDKFQDEVTAAGEMVKTLVEGESFFIDQDNWDSNYVFVPPVEVNFDYPYVNAIAGMDPSPDWFTGFYLFDTVDEYDRTFWDRFTLRTYPWDSGTDGGDHYSSSDRDMDPPENIERIYAQNAPASGAFLDPSGTKVLPVGEFDCVLHTCPENMGDCNKPDWPPKNFCDVLRFPNCASYCDPEKDEICESCKGNGFEPKTVYLPGCCEAGHEPWKGECSAASALTLGLSLLGAIAGVVYLLV